MKKAIYLISIILLLISSLPSMAQQRIDEGLEIDKMVHDFGDIMLDTGPVTCVFTVTNKSEKPAVIYNVATSCGCTDVKWTREPIRSGAKGKISVTYSNDEGPYPFDKSVTVYLSGIKKPIILKLRGHSRVKKLPLKEMYPERFGPLGVKATVIKAGNMQQEGVKSGMIKIANISENAVNVSFSGTTPELTLKVEPNPIPANSVADLKYTITASRQKWGKNYYDTKIVADGKVQNGKISLWGYTKENFDDWTPEQRANASNVMFESSQFSFGLVKKGTIINAEYEFRNIGKSKFEVYKIDVDSGRAMHNGFPVVGPGERGRFNITLDTSTMPLGETNAIVTLTTNSPLRPIVNLFIVGWLQ